MYIDIDINKRFIEPKLQLCKPNLSKEPIGNLTFAHGIRNKIGIGNISELSFRLPIYVDQRHRHKKTPHIDKVKERYFIKLTKGSYEEYYVITKINDVMEDDSEYREVECYGLGYSLSDKRIRSFSTTSLNLSSTITPLLKGTGWSLGSVDARFDVRFRSFEITGTVLDAIIQVAETFGAVIVWDTHNKSISFKDLEDIGAKRGFKIKYGKLLKTLNRESNAGEMCTRLVGYGQDGVTINRVNPTGSNYIQSFDYFMYPFQVDENNNVIQSSDYMSDELCLAIKDYEKKIEDHRAVFENYLSQLDLKTEELLDLENDLYDLQNDLAIINDELSTANAVGDPVSELIIRKNNKLNQINQKNNEINNVKSEITSIQNNINELRNLLAEENNFTSEQLEELSQFVIVEEYSNSHIIDPKQLYDVMTEEFDKIRAPKLVVNIDIENLFSIVSEQKNWDRLNLGDVVEVEHERLGINVEARIMEIEFDYDDNNINLTIANVKDILDDQERFIRDMYKTVSSSASLLDNLKKWNDTSEKTSEVYETIHSTWDATKRNIIASNNETVEIGRQGIRVHDLSDPDKMVIVQHGQIALSGDGGNTWKTAITSDGVVAERLMGVILAGVNLKIDASTSSGTRTFTVDENGVTINGGRLKIEGGLPPEELDPSFKDSLVNLGKDYNGVVIDTENGLVVTKGDNSVRAIVNATMGLAYQKRVGNNWSNILYYNPSSGRLSIVGDIDALGLKINGSDVLTSDKLKIKGDFIDKIKVEQLDASTAKITTAQIENLIVGTNVQMGANASLSWGNITNKPFIPSNANDIGAIPNTYIDSNGVWTGYLNADRIIAGSINANRISGGEFIAINNLQVGTYTNANKMITLPVSTGAAAAIQATHNGIAPVINLDSGEIYMSSRAYLTYPSDPNRENFRIATKSDLNNVVARFG